MTEHDRVHRTTGEHIRTIDCECSCCGRHWSYTIPAASAYPVRRYGRHWVCAAQDYAHKHGMVLTG